MSARSAERSAAERALSASSLYNSTVNVIIPAIPPLGAQANGVCALSVVADLGVGLGVPNPCTVSLTLMTDGKLNSLSTVSLSMKSKARKCA